MRINKALTVGAPALQIFGLLAALTLASCNDQPQSGPRTDPTEITTRSGIPMIYLAGGQFEMGSDQGNPDEGPVHQVTLSPFLIDKTEVTHAMFTAAELPNPSRWKDDPDKPVESLRWRDAKLYCNERSLMEGFTPCYDEKKPGLPCNFEADGYRLPTEAEWEYAALAGAGGDYDFGSAAKLRQFAIFEENGRKRTHPVGSRKPNRWGIHGMYGNVAEWCQDAYDPGYYASSQVRDPAGPDAGAADVKRVIRGGSWKASATMCRARFRQGKQTGDS
ncbi:MAG: formylglycine-generating enzyme family protein, partial [Akkermansiaceae bacterium]|nr:formylglycine-generating enzyme family protein [Akkermansiaceae bacterium]